MKKVSGFTLIELMITVGIAGIVMAFAVPSMSSFIKGDRLVGASNDLLADIMFARSSAVTRNQPVILCPSTNQATCTNNSYEDGWIVTVDTDNDDIGDEVIRVHGALEGNITYSTVGLATINFDSRGFMADDTNIGTISVCDDRSNPDDYAKTISLSVTGRASRGAAPVCP